MEGESTVILSVRNLQTYFYTDAGVARAVEGVSFDLAKGKTLALVGESGCGKSMTALSIMRLIPEPPGKIVGGEIFFESEDLVNATDREMCSRFMAFAVRGPVVRQRRLASESRLSNQSTSVEGRRVRTLAGRSRVVPSVYPSAIHADLKRSGQSQFDV